MNTKIIVAFLNLVRIEEILFLFLLRIKENFESARFSKEEKEIKYLVLNTFLQ